MAQPPTDSENQPLTAQEILPAGGQRLENEGPRTEKSQFLDFLGVLFDAIIQHNKNSTLRGSAPTEELRKVRMDLLALLDHFPRLATDFPTAKLVARIDKYMDCSTSVYVVALVYLDRITARLGVFLDQRVFFHLFFGCVSLARKMMEDKVLELEYVAKVGGLLPHHFGPSVGRGQMFNLELVLIRGLGWDMVVSEADFWNYFSRLSTGAGISEKVLLSH